MYGLWRLCNTTALKVSNARDEFTERLCRWLDNVTVENDDALRIISRYDCIGAFHFVDPPYINSDCGHYKGLFGLDDMQRFIDLLSGVQGKFMLTMFPYDPISAAKDVRRKQEEWMVCNYEPEVDAKPQTLF